MSFAADVPLRLLAKQSNFQEKKNSWGPSDCVLQCSAVPITTTKVPRTAKKLKENKEEEEEN